MFNETCSKQYCMGITWTLFCIFWRLWDFVLGKKTCKYSNNSKFQALSLCRKLACPQWKTVTWDYCKSSNVVSVFVNVIVFPQNFHFQTFSRWPWSMRRLSSLVIAASTHFLSYFCRLDGEFQVGYSWRKMEAVALDRAEWRQVVCGLWYTGSGARYKSRVKCRMRKFSLYSKTD